MKVKILGCGNSVGVPTIGCDCNVCLSNNEKNKRSRASIFIETNQTKILIDASPDLRSQALMNNINSVDGVFFTHLHYDHTSGIHELFAFFPYGNNHAIPIYADSETMEYLESIAGYMFIPKVSTAPWKRCYLTKNIINYYKEFYIGKEKFFVFPQKHGKINCSGIIVNDTFAYCTDVGAIPDRAIDLMKNLNLKLLIIECFSYREAPSHSNLDMALEYINKIKPEKAFFTHMTHEIDYNSLVQKLESLNVTNALPAYDNLVVTI